MTDAAGRELEMVVGLEVHVQLATRTKLLCRCATEPADAPNTNVCPVCLALPGTLPVLSLHAVELAARAALVLGCTVHPVSAFFRRHEFHPTVPRGYQVTQAGEPLASAGELEIGRRPDGVPITVGIDRLHLEEEAGEVVSGRFIGADGVDLNRAGIPLLEIVTAPHIRSPEAAAAFVRVLRERLEYAAVTDPQNGKAAFRVDASISARGRGGVDLGVRTEIRNLHSAAAVERALRAEFARQCALIGDGSDVTPCVLDWDDASATVTVIGLRETASDRRDLPDPDLPPLVLEDEWLARVKREMPEVPEHRHMRLMRDYGLDTVEAQALVDHRPLADYFEHTARHYCREREDYRTVSRWVLGEMRRSLAETGQDVRSFRVRPADLAALLGFVRAGTVSRTVAVGVWHTMVRTGELPAQVVEREVLSASPPRAGRTPAV